MASTTAEHRSRDLLRDAAFASAFLASYLLLDWVSYIHPMQQYSITPWNPQPALVIALLVLRGQRFLPLAFAAVLGAEWLVRGSATPVGAMLLNAAVLTLGYAALARALVGRFAIRPALDTQRDVLRLAAVVSVGTFVTGILYVSALLASNLGPLREPFTALMRFWIGDTAGILVTLPLVLMLSTAQRRREIGGLRLRPEAVLHAAIVSAAMLFVFALRPDDLVKFFYVLFLPLVAVAARLGLAGAALATLALQAAIIVSGELAHYQALTFFELQALLIALSVTGLFLGVTVDERSRTERELRESMRLAAAGEMAAALAHELHQPLTAIGNYAEAGRLIAERGDAALLKDTLGKLSAESVRAAEVVQRLRDFFRTGAMRLEAVQLEELVRRIAARVSAARPAHDIRVEARDSPAVLADRTQIEVVLRNLIANAAEASRDAVPPRVEVVLSRRGGQALVEVRDNGGGIRTEDAERIFEPFHTTGAAGMGLGLSISRTLVEAHGGRMWAQPGPSGLVCFTLPLGGANG